MSLSNEIDSFTKTVKISLGSGVRSRESRVLSGTFNLERENSGGSLARIRSIHVVSVSRNKKISVAISRKTLIQKIEEYFNRVRVVLSQL